MQLFFCFSLHFYFHQFSAVYIAHTADWKVSIHIRQDGSLHGLIFVAPDFLPLGSVANIPSPNEPLLLQIDPLVDHAEQVDSNVYRALMSKIRTNMEGKPGELELVMFASSDLKQQLDQNCGTNEAMGSLEFLPSGQTGEHTIGASHPSLVLDSNKDTFLTSSSSDSRRGLLQLEVWNDCYPNQQFKRLLQMGVATDYSFNERFTTAQIQDKIAEVSLN